MPFIKADAQIEGHYGRVYQHCTYAPDGSNWAAEVEEVKPGETEITAEEHAAILAANVAALAQAAQADPALDAEATAAVLASLAETPLLDAGSVQDIERAALSVRERGAPLSEPVPVAIAEATT